jgi:hypothetical protein
LRDAEDLTIREVYRLEGISDLADMAVVYTVDSISGIQGSRSTPCGMYADPAKAAVWAEIPLGWRIWGATRAQHCQVALQRPYTFVLPVSESFWPAQRLASSWSLKYADTNFDEERTITLEKVLYTAQAHASASRDGGVSQRRWRARTVLSHAALLA